MSLFGGDTLILTPSFPVYVLGFDLSNVNVSSLPFYFGESQADGSSWFTSPLPEDAVLTEKLDLCAFVSWRLLTLF